jgi:GT2 family glycosyltransferase
VTGLSVVVPCRDRAGLLRDCLTALATEVDEVIVVDAGSVGPDVADAALAAGARVLRGTGSASQARNLGWRAATSPLVAFVDDDCRPLAGWGAAMVTALGALSAVCGQVRPLGAGHLSVLEDTTPSDYRSGLHPALLGHGANLGVRRDALDLVGGWDERLGPGTRWPGAEDKDLLLRLLAAGATAGYRPEPVVEHLQWRSRRQSLRAEMGYGRGAGALAAKGLGPSAGTWAREALGASGRDLRAGYEYGAVAGLLRAGAVLWGRATAASLR